MQTGIYGPRFGVTLLTELDLDKSDPDVTWITGKRVQDPWSWYRMDDKQERDALDAYRKLLGVTVAFQRDHLKESAVDWVVWKGILEDVKAGMVGHEAQDRFVPSQRSKKITIKLDDLNQKERKFMVTQAEFFEFVREQLAVIFPVIRKNNGDSGQLIIDGISTRLDAIQRSAISAKVATVSTKS